MNDVLADGPVRIDIGAGNKKREGWLSLGLEDDHDIHCDIRKLPLPDDFADEAMAIHVIEHVAPYYAVPTLKEWRRVLKPGALLILELPDLLKCCRAILAGKGPRDGLWGCYGEPSESNPMMAHLWGYSPASISVALKEAGFVKIRERAPQFHAQRLDRDMRIEARKPANG